MSTDADKSQVLPEFWILRGETEFVETRYFRPKDLITIVILKTGTWRTTQVNMTDEIGQKRYGGMSSGAYHVLTTRLQNTKSYGDWLLHIEGPLMDSDNIFQINLVFHIKKEIDEDFMEKPVMLNKENEIIEVTYILEDSSQKGVELQSIKGIGPTYANRLFEAEIYFVTQLIEYTAEQLSEISKAKLQQCILWLDQAKTLI